MVEVEVEVEVEGSVVSFSACCGGAETCVGPQL